MPASIRTEAVRETGEPAPGVRYTRRRRSTDISMRVLVLAALVVLAMFRPALARDPGYLDEFPDPQRVFRDIQGRDRLDTLARQLGALDRLAGIMVEMAGSRASRLLPAFGFGLVFGRSTDLLNVAATKGTRGFVVGLIAAGLRFAVLLVIASVRGKRFERDELPWFFSTIGDEDAMPTEPGRAPAAPTTEQERPSPIR